MNASTRDRLEQFMHGLKRRNPGENEFHQAVIEVAEDILPFIEDKPIYTEMRILERFTEPDRIIIFRVCWVDDKGNTRVNRGFRVQHNNAIGPYKGGIRFHSDLRLSVLKALAFDQTLKNSLTGLPMGGAKGGADFNPKGKSDGEVMRFCQSYMTELYRHIGPQTDIPAGDIGVGIREISFLFGQYRRLTNTFTGALTGKGLAFGGSLIRTEATGYGCVYMMEAMLKRKGQDLSDKTALVSGSGNVAQYTAEKLIELGAHVVTLSDSSGFIYDPEGIDTEKMEYVKQLKNVERGRIQEYARKYGVEYHEGQKPWKVPCDLAFPCATQNEIDTDDAKTLVKNGCMALAEGANLPTSLGGVRVFQDAKILYATSISASAGGVAVSGLEMTQNVMRLTWSREELDKQLCSIMTDIHEKCVEYGTEGDYVNYRRGANIAGFFKVANAMLACGVV
jgi:glutamate dehydrogenase (NADP+)